MSERERLHGGLLSLTHSLVQFRSQYIECIMELYDNFVALSLADAGFVSKIIVNMGSLEQGIWEMRLGEHLASLGYSPQKVAEGPDFKISINGATAWVEAIAPTRGMGANAVPDYFEITTQGTVVGTPTEQIMMRYTQAIRDKKVRLEHYLRQGIVDEAEPYILAINSVLLQSWGYRYINNLPYAACALFALGPLQIHIDRHSGDATGQSHAYAPVLYNQNQAPIPADGFMNPAYKHISAILTVHDDLVQNIAAGRLQESAIIHNPLAVTKIPLGILGADVDYYVPQADDHWAEWELATYS